MICQRCNQVPENPQQCYNCKATFCLECATHISKEEGNICPSCNKPPNQVLKDRARREWDKRS